MNEFELIGRFFTHPSPGAVLGVGDDAALVRVTPRHELAISADMLLEGRHFFPRADAELLGHKALAVNLSDMAAMGARPRWATLCVALPSVNARWLEGFMRGFMSLARAHKVDLIGGDTTRGPLAISVQIMGEVPKGRALRRDRARVDDDVWVSGMIGSAALALAGRLKRIAIPAKNTRALAERLHQPTPRVALGRALIGVAHSAVDISDGLLADLGHICERSGVGAEIAWEQLPTDLFVRAQAQRSDVAREAILAGGDDYELCFTAPQKRRAAVVAAARRSRTMVTRVGRIAARTGGAPVRVLDAIGKPVRTAFKGFNHFA